MSAAAKQQHSKTKTVATIGYEGVTVAAFLETVKAAKVDLLVDVRAIASSRRPGFAKTALAANLETIGVGYRHVRSLGTPADGRAAARAGHHDELRRIYLAHLATEAAQEGLHEVVELVESGTRIVLLCFEPGAAHCHRRFVANALAERVPIEIIDLTVRDTWEEE